MSDHDEGKLPRWARDRLDRLRRELAGVRRENATLRGEFDTADEDGYSMRIERGSARHDEPPVLALPVGPYRFTLQTPHGYGVEISGQRGGVCALLESDPFAGVEALSVRPQASNVIILRGEPL